MGQKYHIDINGKPAVCRATVRACSRGGSDQHFESREEAQKFQDERNERLYKNHGQKMDDVSRFESDISRAKENMKFYKKNLTKQNIDDAIKNLKEIQYRIDESYNTIKKGNEEKMDADLEYVLKDVDTISNKTNKELSTMIKTMEEYQGKKSKIDEDPSKVKNTIKSKEDKRRIIDDNIKEHMLVSRNNQEISSEKIYNNINKGLEKEKSTYIIAQKMSLINDSINIVERNSKKRLDTSNLTININNDLNEMKIYENNKEFEIDEQSSKEIKELLKKSNEDVKNIENNFYTRDNIIKHTSNIIDYDTSDEGYFFADNLAKELQN